MFKKYKNQDLDVAFWWKKNPKTSSDYVKLIIDQLSKIGSASTSDGRRKAQEECSRYLIGVRHFILRETDPKPTEASIDELYSAMHQGDLFYDLLLHITDLEFEARKEVLFIFSICLNYSKDNKFVTVDYFVSEPKTITLILRTAELILQKSDAPQDVELIIGNMILDCIKHEQLCRIILRDPQLWKFFDFARITNFEISTMALQVLNDMFTTHPRLVSREFFSQEKNLAKFIRNINQLIAHGNYVTKRQSTKILASLIMEKANSQLMLTYINSPDNLKLIMTLMTDKSKNLQLDAFNVFKVIVANPRKTKPVFDILVKNRDNLLKYFESFATDNQDSILQDEKHFVMQEIDKLPRIVSSNNDNGKPASNTVLVSTSSTSSAKHPAS
ncbi:Hym1p KNAG_0D04560 [Huiozyma naganishii CBS 8797]|uniref:Hym1p n=1 Tax=Huiozyma naganishii (strain ATCC MYA-139 / BCRC 22969 / CBS 8797 / KCTC 17520 / NBRC 10181 / NCYC 3082 / Yp74L-3) TaxID=1071383 RepID=J7S7A1_HUIN7|nr:hypothetical protein KNAG_0D04560 [Kazachstania naganishii CBS 8797]CCK70201.1 hypothetical protein KNAG_0D04560 [Kazachstania naganishii CBS 8797]